MSQPEPLLTTLDELPACWAGQGWAVIDAEALEQRCGVTATDLAALQASWGELPPDPHLRDGGHYRRRRHGCYVVDGATVAAVPHRAHWQPVEYNALHGGFERWFEPLHRTTDGSASWRQLIAGVTSIASELMGPRRWFVEAHVFRIDTTGGIGRPTPEGAHRDGVDLVAVVLVDRHHIKGPQQ